MSIPIVEMCKIPSVRGEVLKALKVSYEVEYPPVIVNTMYHGKKREENPPFYLYFGANDIHLNNCMLYSGDSTNFMSLKIMKQLCLNMTCPYETNCGIDSKKVKVYGLAKDG
jgi:hypothetical protein